MKSTKPLLIASALAFTLPAYADLYGAVSFDRNTLDSGVSGTSGTATLDEDDTGFTLLVGMPVQPNLDVEVVYKDLGAATFSGASGDTFILDGTAYSLTADLALKAEGSAVALGGRYRFDVNESITPFVKAGLVMWDLDATATVGSTTAKVSDDDSDVYVGLGALVPVTETLSLRTEYMQFDDFSGFSLGLETRF